MWVEVGKYYITRDKKIVKVEYDEFCENPITWIGSLGVDDEDLEHLATCYLSFEESKERYKERCIPLGYSSYTSSSYTFFVDNENPRLWINFDELPNENQEQYIQSILDEFEYWLRGEVYNIREYDNDLYVEESMLYIGISNNFNLDVVCEIDKEVNLILDNFENKAILLELIDQKYKKAIKELENE